MLNGSGCHRIMQQRTGMSDVTAWLLVWTMTFLAIGEGVEGEKGIVRFEQAFQSGVAASTDTCDEWGTYVREQLDINEE
jgi:hypothetical protein